LHTERAASMPRRAELRFGNVLHHELRLSLGMRRRQLLRGEYLLAEEGHGRRLQWSF
jgi:hypothetical protein